jgi:hypothetical protein
MSISESAGVPIAKIATIVAGERPTDLSQAVAYDVAAALNRGGPLPETIYQAGVDAFGKQGMGGDYLSRRMLPSGGHYSELLRRAGTR